MPTASIVIDLGFGDGGKGLVVDNLCSRCRDEKPLVVRFSGGQQAGHTVIDPFGVKHIFASFGSGTLAGCPSFFTEDTTMWLPSLLREYDVLVGKNIKPVLTIHPLAMLTTPFDVAYNRAKEDLVRRDGSCGFGVGATMKRCLESPYKTYVGDLEYKELLYHKVYAVKAYYDNLIKDNDALKAMYESYLGDTIDQFSDALERLKIGEHFSIEKDPARLRRNDVIFEGSQGVMLDMDHGVFPNVTYANTTCKNAMKYACKWNLTPAMYYVTRCYTTRHGNGWMPDQRDLNLINTKEEINTHNRWQGDFRIGEFDYDMISHAMKIDMNYHGDFSPRKNLVITCLDQRPDFVLDQTKFLSNHLYTNDSPVRGNMKQL